MTNFPHSNNNELNAIWPNIVNEHITENTIELGLFIPKELDYFKGHFPDAPILAGVVQLHWVVEYAKKMFNLRDKDVLNLEVLKFQVVIVPEQHITLTLIKKSDKKITFSYVSERGKHASGRIIFGNKS